MRASLHLQTSFFTFSFFRVIVAYPARIRMNRSRSNSVRIPSRNGRHRWRNVEITLFAPPVKEPFERHLRDLVLREDGLREGGAEGGAAGARGGGQATGQAGGGGRGRGSSPDAPGQIWHNIRSVLRIRILTICQRFKEIPKNVLIFHQFDKIFLSVTTKMSR